MITLSPKRDQRNLKRMSDLPAQQPFVCPFCYVAFGSGRALEQHLQMPHRPWQLNENDKTMLKSFRIKVEDEE